MFTKKHKPLPKAVFQVAESSTDSSRLATSRQPVSSSVAQPILEPEGILLGDNCYWNPAALSNGHIVVIGASGSGKTQTLKAIAYSMRQTYPDIQVFCVDFHGDQEIIGETCYPLHMASPHGD